MDFKMESDSLDICKLEQDLCRCCHSEGSFKNLAKPFKTANLLETYVDMLKECYAIDMVPIPGLMSAMTYTICEVCIIRLRDAMEFKKQVLQCEERFKDLYKRNGVAAAVTTVDIDIEIKEEVPDLSSDDVFKKDLSVEDSDDWPLSAKDEDYEVSEDLNANEEVEAEEKPAKVEVRKKKKYKKKVVKTKSVKSKRKKEKNLKEEPAEEHEEEPAEEPVAEKKQTERAPPFPLKDGEDYKKEGDKYHCSRCGKIYCNKKSLTNHVKKLHFKIKKFECSICIDAFETESLLTVHKLEVHNVDQRVTCGICNKFFNAKCYLTIHIRNYHLQGEIGQRYKCEFCDFVTLKKKNLSKHKFTHKTVKDFNCQYCKKSFKRRTTLNFHERIHTGDRRKVCSECGQAFVQKASLNYHMTKYHPNVKF